MSVFSRASPVALTAAMVFFLLVAAAAHPRGRRPAATPASANDQLASILAPVLGAEKSDFRMDGCGIPPDDIMRFVLLSQPFISLLRFGPGCDVQGLLNVDTRPAPLDLRVRRLGAITRVRGRITSVAGLADSAPFGFTIDVTEGEMMLEGHRLPLEFSSEASIGYGSIFAVGRAGTPTGHIDVHGYDGQVAHFHGRLEFARRAE